jgi:hypothetical protein
MSKVKRTKIPKTVEKELNGQRQLIVIAKQEAKLRSTKEGTITSRTGANIDPLQKLLNSRQLVMEPLFGISEDRLEEKMRSLSSFSKTEVPDLSIYYLIKAPDEKLDQLAKDLLKLDTIEAAYVKPPAEPASMMLNDIEPIAEEPPTLTPNFATRQMYLGQAPVGIDAEYAWTIAGGRGTGVNIIDLEWGWNFNHEDLLQTQGGVVSGTNSSDNDHGTAVIGEFSGDTNAFGITGISPEAHVSAISLVTNTTSQAIRSAADRLSPGDIMLLEVHRSGPISGISQFGYIAIEWWPDDFDAIRYAISKGIIVVEAAGNGGQNLDDSIYNTPLSGFPTSWRNPFNISNPSSGAILVGAGNPPTGTHGRNADATFGEVYTDRARCFFSNYGSRLDTQGWGWEVTSTGYGDLQGGSNSNEWYTDEFSGTSSASPIVVGTLACVQGILRNQGRIPLSPARAKEILRTSGSSQQNGPSFNFNTGTQGSYPQPHPSRPQTQRIGNRPDLRQIIDLVLQTGSWTGIQWNGQLDANQTLCWFTHDWPEHWHIIWTVVPITPGMGTPQIKWKVKTERASDEYITYWICVTNLTSNLVEIEGRYAVLGW